MLRINLLVLLRIFKTNVSSEEFRTQARSQINIEKAQNTLEMAHVW